MADLNGIDGAVLQLIEAHEECAHFGLQTEVDCITLPPRLVVAGESILALAARRRVANRLTIPDDEVQDRAKVEILHELQESLTSG